MSELRPGDMSRRVVAADVVPVWTIKIPEGFYDPLGEPAKYEPHPDEVSRLEKWSKENQR